MSRLKLVIGGVCVGLIIIGGFTVARGWSALGIAPKTFHGQALESTSPAANFTLATAGGKPVSLEDFRGKAVFIYFGYRMCPDVCPLTLGRLKKMMASIGPKAGQVQVLMVSVDPERDTPDLVDELVKRFDERFVGLSGTPDEIAAVARQFGIFYQREPGSENTGYLVSHTVSVLAIDANGYWRVVYPPDTEAATMAADIDLLLRP